VQKSVDKHLDHRHARHTLNILNTPKRDLGMVGAMLHVVGDALNNVAVITAGAIIWFTSSPTRFYADPAVSMAISVIIFLSALSLVKKSGRILLQSAPRGVNLADVKHDIEKVCTFFTLEVHHRQTSLSLLTHAFLPIDSWHRVSPRTPCLATRPVESHCLGPRHRLGFQH
jgi:Co/Zn/Cd efflux system component